MGFFGSLLGKDQKKATRKANKQAQADLKAAYNAAVPLLDKGYTTASDALTTGHNNAMAAARAGYDTARATLQPWVDEGLKANKFYGDLLGLDGAEARDEAQAVIASDKLWQGELAAGQNAMLRMRNARGGTNTGKTLLAGQRVLSEQYGNWMDRYRQRADTGGQYARDLSDYDYRYGVDTADRHSTYAANRGNLATRYYGQKADLRYGYGASKAGLAIGKGNAMVQAMNSGVNNVLGLVGAGADAAESGSKAYAAMAAASDRRLKRDIVQTGELPSGLPIYRFKYLWDDEELEGVMADEAELIFPDAVFVGPGGFQMVDYSQIG